MNARDFAAEERQVRKQAARWIGGCLLAGAVVWLLGASRFALFSAVFAVPFAVLGWSPSERRIAPDRPDKPCRVAAPVPAAAAFVVLVAQTVILLPHPQYMILAAVLPVAFGYVWLTAQRWPRFHPPTS